MSSFVYTPAKAKLLSGDLDFETHHIRVMLLMSNTTAGVQEDTATISGFTTLDEYDGTNYARQALTAKVVNQNNANNRGEFDADDVTWTALGAGARNCVAILVYHYVTNDEDSIPIAYIDNAPQFPFNGNGGDVTIQWNANGIIWAS